MSESKGWIAVDLDGTLAKYDGWKGATIIGEPVPRMLARVKKWLKQGEDVRIFTARVAPYEKSDSDLMFQSPEERAAKWKRDREVQAARYAIDDWCRLHLGRTLPVTHCKDLQMVELWDDRCMQVIPNTGETMEEQVTELSRRLGLPR